MDRHLPGRPRNPTELPGPQTCPPESRCWDSRGGAGRWVDFLVCRRRSSSLSKAPWSRRLRTPQERSCPSVSRDQTRKGTGAVSCPKVGGIVGSTARGLDGELPPPGVGSTLGTLFTKFRVPDWRGGAVSLVVGGGQRASLRVSGPGSKPQPGRGWDGTRPGAEK